MPASDQLCVGMRPSRIWRPGKRTPQARCRAVEEAASSIARSNAETARRAAGRVSLYWVIKASCRCATAARLTEAQGLRTPLPVDPERAGAVRPPPAVRSRLRYLTRRGPQTSSPFSATSSPCHRSSESSWPTGVAVTQLWPRFRLPCAKDTTFGTYDGRDGTPRASSPISTLHAAANATSRWRSSGVPVASASGHPTSCVRAGPGRRMRLRGWPMPRPRTETHQSPPCDEGDTSSKGEARAVGHASSSDYRPRHRAAVQACISASRKGTAHCGQPAHVAGPWGRALPAPALLQGARRSPRRTIRLAAARAASLASSSAVNGSRGGPHGRRSTGCSPAALSGAYPGCHSWPVTASRRFWPHSLKQWKLRLVLVERSRWRNRGSDHWRNLERDECSRHR